MGSEVRHIFAEALSGYGSMRATLDLRGAKLAVERWGHQYRLSDARALEPPELERLRELAAAVRQEEAAQIVGDFFAVGEERLRVERADRTIELHNDSDRIRTPGAEPLLAYVWELAGALVPHPEDRARG